MNNKNKATTHQLFKGGEKKEEYSLYKIKTKRAMQRFEAWITTTTNTTQKLQRVIIKLKRFPTG